MEWLLMICAINTRSIVSSFFSSHPSLFHTPHPFLPHCPCIFFPSFVLFSRPMLMFPKLFHAVLALPPNALSLHSVSWNCCQKVFSLFLSRSPPPQDVMGKILQILTAPGSKETLTELVWGICSYTLKNQKTFAGFLTEMIKWNKFCHVHIPAALVCFQQKHVFALNQNRISKSLGYEAILHSTGIELLCFVAADHWRIISCNIFCLWQKWVLLWQQLLFLWMHRICKATYFTHPACLILVYQILWLIKGIVDQEIILLLFVFTFTFTSFTYPHGVLNT